MSAAEAREAAVLALEGWAADATGKHSEAVRALKEAAEAIRALPLPESPPGVLGEEERAAVDRLTAALPHMKIAAAEAAAEFAPDGAVGLAIIATKPSGAGRLTARFEGAEFFADLARLLASHRALADRVAEMTGVSHSRTAALRDALTERDAVRGERDAARAEAERLTVALTTASDLAAGVEHIAAGLERDVAKLNAEGVQAGLRIRAAEREAERLRVSVDEHVAVMEAQGGVLAEQDTEIGRLRGQVAEAREALTGQDDKRAIYGALAALTREPAESRRP